MTGIYIIRNKENGKVYIGQSINIFQRWRQHKYELRHNAHHSPHFQHAYNQNPKAFEYSILFECDAEELDEAEEKFIKAFKSCDPNYGYNIMIKPRGTGCEPESVRKKVSDYMKGRDNGHMRGRTLSESWRRHISDAQPHKRAVICVETLVVYKSAFDAARETGIGRSKIVSCCTGNNKTAGGYHWAYHEDYIADPEYYADMLEKYVPTKTTGAKIICLDTGVIYPTAREASRLLEISPSALCQCLRGRSKTAGGYHWAYYDER